MTISIYIHFPFCVRKCGYCDFVSRPLRDRGEADRYIRFIGREIQLAGATPGIGGREVRTIFFGGGTPSLMTPGQINTILSTIRSYFSIAPGAEISIESNPGSVSDPDEWLAGARAAGINRLVIGMQSMNNANLKFLGRIHNRDESVDFYRRARCAGFRSVGLDLIYGLPEQTVDEWKRDLEGALELKPDHVSIYCLEICPGTPLGRDLGDGVIHEAEGEIQAEMYHAACEMLEAAGLRRYEISNFSLPGHECRHNLAYWTGDDYLGVGISASSHLGGWRWENERAPDAYTGKVGSGTLPRLAGELLSSRRRLRELAVICLRTAAGFRLPDPRTVHERELTADLSELVEEGFLELTGAGVFRLKPEYLFVSDAVFSRIVG